MRASLFILLALLAAVPAFALRLGGLAPPVELATLGFGLGVVGAAFAMLWAAEAAERDVPRALALTAVALLAVFPEYAVDIIFAFKAGQDPTFAPYAAANMTGSNRLLLGLGWPTVSVLAWLFRGQQRLVLTRDAVLPLFFLAVATIYSFILPLKANIGPIDSVVLFALFGGYAVLAGREETVEPDLVGPAATIGALLALRGKATAGLGLLLSAKVNQWTLLVGSLPLAYSLGAGRPDALPLDTRQVAEVWLTAAQSLFGVAVLASLSLELGESVLLAGLFLAQFIVGGVIRTGLRDTGSGEAELIVFSIVYILLSLVFAVRARGVLGTLWRKRRDRTRRGRQKPLVASRRDLV